MGIKSGRYAIASNLKPAQNYYLNAIFLQFQCNSKYDFFCIFARKCWVFGLVIFLLKMLFLLLLKMNFEYIRKRSEQLRNSTMHIRISTDNTHGQISHPYGITAFNAC